MAPDALHRSDATAPGLFSWTVEESNVRVSLALEVRTASDLATSAGRKSGSLIRLDERGRISLSIDGRRNDLMVDAVWLGDA
jgi:hypothetical protein